MKNKTIQLIVFGLAIFNVSVIKSWGYDKDRCRSRFPKLFTSEMGFFTTTHPTETSTYFSQSTSSWGECSLIGQTEQREVFIAVNSDNIMLDSARGRGEYIDALAQLSGCDSEESRKSLSTALQKNFEIIYMDGQRAAPPEEIRTRIDKLISSQPHLRKACKLSG